MPVPFCFKVRSGTFLVPFYFKFRSGVFLPPFCSTLRSNKFLPPVRSMNVSESRAGSSMVPGRFDSYTFPCRWQSLARGPEYGASPTVLRIRIRRRGR